MFISSLSLATPISYHFCGKFKAPNPSWIHLTRELSDFELFMVTEGILYIADTEKKYSIGQDEYLIMPPTKKQYGYESSDCSFFWLHFQTSNLNSSEQSDMTFPQHGSIPNIERIMILLNQLQDTERRYHHEYTNDLLATGILMELYNQIQSKHKVNSLTSKTQLYQAILDYISWNRFNRIRVTDLSEYFGYHEKYLSTMFKHMSGISLKHYLLQVSMEHAKAELMNTNKTISQIGSSIGYTDSHNFSNAFKNVVGVTPSEYRISCIKIPKTP